MLHRPLMGTWCPNLIDEVPCLVLCVQWLSEGMWAGLPDCRCSTDREFRKKAGGEIGDEQLKLWEELSTTSAANLKYNDSSIGRWDVCQSVNTGFWDIIFPWEHVRKCVWSSFRTFLFPFLSTFSWRRLPAEFYLQVLSEVSAQVIPWEL